MTRRPKTNNNDANEPTLENRFTLKKIQPLTVNQKITFEEYSHSQNLMLHGCAGTGKTYVGMYLALREVMTKANFEKLIIIRSTVQTRDMGFLPGSSTEKIKVFEEPYFHITSDLFGRKDAYPVLKQKGVIEFTSTSFLRGITFENSIILVDECQSMIFHELNTIMTRLGENSKIIFCGDFRQNDLESSREKSGLKDFKNILGNMDKFSVVEFEEDDIVRSGIVKEYIKESNKYFDDKL